MGTHNEVVDLLSEARQSGISVFHEGEKLKFKVAKNKVIDPKIIDKLRKKKSEILAFLIDDIGQAAGLKNFRAAIRPYDKSQYPRIPLSFAQERLWFIDQYNGSVQYHIPTVLRLKNQLDRRVLADALAALVQRHQVLRTIVQSEGGQPYQVVRSAQDWELAYTDRSGQTESNFLKTLINTEVNRPFDLAKDYMLRAHLIKCGTDNHVLVLVIHHIASDGWSNSILVKDLIELYSSIKDQRQASLRPLPVQYTDYAIWQRHTSSNRLEAQLDWWEKQLSGLEVLELPTDFPRPAMQSTQGAGMSFQVDRQLTSQLKALALEAEATLFMTLLAAFKIFLYRYSGQNDISIGTPTANRHQKEVEPLVGFFINTLVLRTKLEGDWIFSTLLKRIKTETLAAFARQEVPFEQIVDRVESTRSLSHNPLFQVMFILQNAQEIPKLELGELSLYAETAERQTTLFDLVFSISENTDGMSVKVVYGKELFARETIDRMAGHFQQLLKAIVEYPEEKIARLGLLSPAEEQQLLGDFNDTAVDYSRGKSIIDLLEAQVEKSPDQTALIFEAQSLSYSQLNEKANQLARAMLEKVPDFSKGDSIGVLIDRSEWSAIAMIAIMKIGGLYVPIDPAYPDSRLAFILENSAAHLVLINDPRLGSRLKESSLATLDLDEEVDWKQLAKNNLHTPIEGKDASYLIYTSGSTGNPKGVVQSHLTLYNLIHWNKEASGQLKKQNYLQYSSFSFDMSLYEIYYALSTGGRVHICSEDLRKDLWGLKEYILKNEISTISMPYSALKLLFDEFGEEGLENHHLWEIISAGEQLLISGGLRDFLEKNPEVKLYNLYGPSETHVVTGLCYSAVEGELPLEASIGKPVHNTWVYLLDKEKQMVPIGVEGELYLGGHHLALGYKGNEEGTAARFIPDPFKENEMVYKTGDLGKWLPDGTIVYKGRTDNQVKVNGYRIELGEIESVLVNLESVNNAVVLARPDAVGNLRLVAYVIPDGNFDAQQVQDHLKTILPDYMVPGIWVESATFPMTSTGKINRLKLPAPEMAELSTEDFITPVSPIEIQLADIWKRLLHLEAIGTKDNFFKIGGHSLHAMRVIAAIRKEMKREIQVKELFNHPTIAQLGQYLEDIPQEAILPPIEAGHRSKRLPLSYGQERIWFVDQFEGSVQYHMPTVLRLKRVLDKDLLEQALADLVQRHEILRTNLLSEEGQAYQEVISPDGWQMAFTDDSLYREEEPQKKLIADIVAQAFDLSKDYKLRAHLIRCGEADHVLVLVIHHIACDGWSNSLLIKDLSLLYQARLEGVQAPLESLPVQYADYAIWQRKYLSGTYLQNQLDWWEQRLMGLETLEIPSDFPRPRVQSTQGASWGFVVEKELLDQLKSLSLTSEATLFMTLLAVFKVMLYRYSNQTDICVGTPLANRDQQEIESVVGFFINNLVLRNDLSGNPKFSTLLELVKQNTLAAFAYQDAPFEQIVDRVEKERSLSHSPIFQVMFALQNTPDAPQLELGDLSLSSQSAGLNRIMFDLSFSITESKFGLQVGIAYCRDLFARTTIEGMGQHFLELLATVVRNPDQTIAELPMLTAGEEEQLVFDFNNITAKYNGASEQLQKMHTLVGLFRQQAQSHPDQVAVVFEENNWTYRELDEASSRLARYLQQTHKVKPEDLVGLLIKRSDWAIVAILGILKAGVAYVPIHVETPEDRKNWMIEDTGIGVLISLEEHRDAFQDLDLEVVVLDAQWQNIEDCLPLRAEEMAIRSDQLAYVIYTSGSTGRPKGVMIEHRSICNTILSQIAEFEISPADNCLQFASLSFDASVWEIFLGILSGARLCVIGEEASKNFDGFIDYVDTHRLSIATLPPSFFAELNVEKLTSLRILITAGESAVVDKAAEFVKGSTFYNAYGPTESSICATTFKVDQGEEIKGTNIPIGSPIANTELYILDELGHLVPRGVIGELCIAGKGLARGYWNRPELTLEKFIVHPTLKGGGLRLYKTGDLARWLPSGNVEFKGRKDTQVKIRGHRIELEEIEVVLNALPQVQNGVVLLKEIGQNNLQLVAYLVVEVDFDQNKLQKELERTLPDYMIPTIWMPMESLPLTSSNKVDRKALPHPEISEQIESSFIAPSTPMETVLAEIWRELLQLDQVGINDNFFAIGGHSLLAMRVIAALRKKLEREIVVKDIFAQSTIRELAAFLESQAAKVVTAPMVRVARPERIPLSYAQERIWFIDQLGGSVEYHMPNVLHLKNKLETDLLETALKALVDRHEVLRTMIRMEEDGNPYQVVLSAADWKLVRRDWENTASADDLQAHIAEVVNRPFDLARDFKLRAHLLRCSSEHHVLILVVHHIASDGWSQSLLVKDLAALYRALKHKEEPKLAPLNFQYADYAIWQRANLSGEHLSAKLDWWESQLRGIEPLRLPTDYPRPAIQSTKGASLGFRLNSETSDQLKSISLSRGTTLFMTMLAAFKVLLHRYSGQADLCVGTPVANREHREIESLVGFFISTLALRNDLSGNPRFVEVLEQVKTNTLAAFRYQEVPFEKVVERVEKERSLSRSPIFQVEFVFQNMPKAEDLKLGEVNLASGATGQATSQFDLSASVMETPNGLLIGLTYCTDLFSRERMNCLCGHFENLIQAIVANPEEHIGQLNLISEEERRQLLDDFSGPVIAYPTGKTALDVIGGKVDQYPSALAVICGEDSLTYAELDKRSNQLGNYLLQKGLEREKLVGVCMDRSIEMLISILGIMKSGGAYLPIDPNYPKQRLDYILEDSQLQWIIVGQSGKEILPDSANYDRILLEEQWAEIAHASAERPDVDIQPGDLAYVIYTSGSTGRPKGVMIEHEGMLNHLYAKINDLSIQVGNRVLQNASQSFDISIWQFLVALLEGGTTVVYPQEIVLKPTLFLKKIVEDALTHVEVVPSYLRVLLDEIGKDELEFPNLQYLLVTGEALPKSLVQRWLERYPAIPMVNAYGPTEASDDITHYHLESLPEAEQIPIGHVLQNLEIYVFNDQLELCPIGVPGEIGVSGIGVGRGYRNRPDLTAEKFISNPFRPGERIYKTGDIGFWYPNGVLAFMGRKDNQVKIRGHRIELGEIESVLSQSPDVKENVVLAKADAFKNKQLVAYIVMQTKGKKAKIQAYLERKLPDYMVPSVLVEMEQLPLTPNGKLDRKALPDPEVLDLVARKFVAPRNATEQKLLDIWMTLLQREKIGIYDNFFEIGGHSLMAMRLISAIRKDLQVDLEVRDIFTHSTIEALARHLQGREGQTALPQLLPQVRPEQIPLSYSQERLWFIDQLEGSVQYHIPSVLRFKNALDREVLETALLALVERHESLRTTIQSEKGEAFQMVMPSDRWALAYYVEENENRVRALIKTEVNRPFDLSKDYLLRASLIKCQEEEYVLVLVTHHIASDGWSQTILVQDLTALYNAIKEGLEADLPTLPLQYADYAIWQRQHLSKDFLEARLDWWQQQLQGLNPLTLPTDYPRPAIQSTRGAVLGTVLSEDLSDQLRSLASSLDATLFMTLLAAFKVLLYRYSGQEDLCVGTPLANRNHKEVEPVVGFFINTLALRSDLGKKPTFKELLEQVKENALSAFNYQDVPFEQIVNRVESDRSMSRSPIFQVMFILQNLPAAQKGLDLEDLQLQTEDSGYDTAKFDLTLSIAESGGALKVALIYCRDLFAKASMERFLQHFCNLLESIAINPAERIAQLEIMKREERIELLADSRTSLGFPKDKTIADLFEEQAAKTPEKLALVFEGRHLSYAELNGRANRLAHYLQKHFEIQANDLVGLHMPTSDLALVALLAVLKAGGAYVPLDADLPTNRKQHILTDASLKVLLIDGESSDNWSAFEGEVFNLTEQWDQLNASRDTQNPERNQSTNALAYVIFTSGSTGQSKGVLISHHNLMDYVIGLMVNADIRNNDSFGLMSTLAADLGHTVLYGALLSGGTLHLFAKEMLTNAWLLHKYFDKNPIDCIKIVPSHWNALELEKKGLYPSKTLVFGGEVLPVDYLPKIATAAPGVQVINHYGPTEATVGKLLHKVDFKVEYSQVPIGRPFSNSEAYVVDAAMNLCPVGVPGELLLGGDGIAQGYLNRPKLTREKFVENPFNENSDSRLYRTGDLVKRLAEGDIVFLGRIDDQIKIRGYRVEPGEVEAVLNGMETVNAAVVLAHKDDKGDWRLVAYVVTEADFDQQWLKTYLAVVLPEYMMPSLWIPLENMPLTSNGKVDRKALPAADFSQVLSEKFVEPQHPDEIAMASIWKSLLSLERVGIHDNFFEIGGHSLLAMRLVSAIRTEFGRELEVRDIFSHQTIAKLLDYFGNRAKNIALPPLLPQPRPERIPLSYSQERLWFIDQLEGSTQYHMPSVLRLKNTLDSQALEAALGDFIDRHEILRTAIKSEDGEAYQEVLSTQSWKLPYVEESRFEDSAALQDFIQTEIHRPFDLAVDFKLRACLIRCQGEEHLLILTMHHIASDGWSRSIMVRELTELYQAHQEGRTAALPALPIQYADYAIWQRRYFAGPYLTSKLEWWTRRLEDISPLELPTDFPRPAIQSNRGASFHFELEAELTTALKKLSIENEATLFMTLLTGLQILLSRYSGQEDLCIGTPVANRIHQDLEPLVGFFINTLVLRTDLGGNPTFSSLLEKVKSESLEAMAYQEVPFEQIVEKVEKERSRSRSPIFQVMFIMQNVAAAVGENQGAPDLSTEPIGDGAALFDLTFSATEVADKLQIGMLYCRDLFLPATIERMAGHFERLLRVIVAQPQHAIGLLSMLSNTETDQLLNQFNATERPYPADKTLVELLEQQVAHAQDRIALTVEEEDYTYQQLNERANQLAHYLIKQGLSQGSKVAICVDRSLEMLVALLGVLKAGAAYIPIDPEYPTERIHYILTDSQTDYLIGEKALQFLFEAHADLELLLIDQQWPQIGKESRDNPPRQAGPLDLAYLIYTSGSTGQPKGVMIGHRSLVNFLCSMMAELEVGTELRLLAVTTYCFDISILEIFMPLLAGGSLVLSTGTTASDGHQLQDLLRQSGANHMQATPATWQLLVDSGWENETQITILTGGEAIKEQLKNTLAGFSQQKVWNLYGPTETTIWSSVKALQIEEKISIGQPIANTQIYILNQTDSGQPLLAALGVVGELCIGGDGLALGYWNRPELTAAKFIPDPFNKRPGQKIYRTGDLARWLPNGELECLGRIDDQVKIRGYRIELGEIESVLSTSPLVQQAAVVANTDVQGNTRLVAYVVAAERFDAGALQSYLKTQLPDYMVPALWVEMEQLPLTPAGKTDRKSLSVRAIEIQSTQTYVAPRNTTESKMAQIWKDLLGMEKVGIHDDFFELGGHSLLTIKLQAQIKKHFAQYLPVASIFNAPNIALLSEELTMPREDSTPVLVRLNSGQQQQKLFCVPGVEGHPLSFHKFAALLDQKVSVFAFQAPGIDGASEPLTDIKKLAKLYVDELQKIDPVGPYFIAGYSFGGRVAYKMCTQLAEQGLEVKKLFVLDSIISTEQVDNPLSKFTREQMIRYFAQDFARRYGKELLIEESALEGSSQETQWELLHQRVSALDIEISERQLKGYARVMIAYSQLPYYAPKVLVKPSLDINLFRVRHNYDYGWKNFTAGKVRIIDIDGPHLEILSAPVVRDIRKEILRAMKD